jgi:hypothetical protein
MLWEKWLKKFPDLITKKNKIKIPADQFSKLALGASIIKLVRCLIWKSEIWLGLVKP